MALEQGQAHYLKHVLRRQQNDTVRLFNSKDGEWLAALAFTGKKHVVACVRECLRPQPPAASHIHLLFAPIRKNRMDFLIEKAVELGVTDLHPVITANTEHRHINPARLRAQIIEAAEQCERCDIPVLQESADLAGCLAAWPEAVPVLACLERHQATALSFPVSGAVAALVGPEGGLTADEMRLILSFPFVRPVSLGGTILRAETAALKILSLIGGTDR